MPLAFENPSGLWLLGGLGPLVLAYLLRTRRRRLAVPAVFLWREAERDLLARKPFRRLTPEVTLLLEALALALLALALARPTLPGGLVRVEHVAVVVDSGASMSAAFGGRTRFEAARERAREILARLAPGADALVVEAGHEARAVTGLTGDRRQALLALDRLAVREEQADLPAALALAADRLGGLSGSRRIVLVTDVNADVAPVAKVPLEVERVGSALDNAAVVALELRRAVDPVTARDRADALVSVQNFGDAPLDRFVTLSFRGANAPVASRRLRLEPGERASVVLSFEPGPDDTGKGVVAALAPGDALPADDQAFALVPPGPRLPVVIAPPNGDPWLERALSADASLDLREAPLGALGTASVPKGALVVVVGACPSPPSSGDLLVVAPPPGTCLGARVGAAVRDPRVTWWSDHDPRFRFLTFDDFRVQTANAVDVPRRASLLRAGEATLVADLGLEGRSGTVVAFRPDDSTWPLQASFVLFVRNVTELARENRVRGVSSVARTGEVLRVPIGAAPQKLELRGPGGSMPGLVRDGVVLSPAPSRAGFYDVVPAGGGDPVASVAVDFSSPAESDLRHVPASGGDATIANTDGVAPPPSRIAPLVSLGALVALVAEALWLTRARSPRLRDGARERGSIRSLGLAATALACPFGAYAALVHGGVVEDRLLRLDEPLYLLSLPLAMGVLAARVARRGAPRSLRASVWAALLLSIFAAGFAASEPSVGAPLDRMAVIVAVDTSRSIDLVRDARVRVEHELHAAEPLMRDGDRIGVVAFAAEAALERPLRTRNEPEPAQRPALPRDATDIERGLRRALAEAPPDAATRIVLVSDGVSTRGDTASAALAASLAGVPIDVLPLEQDEVRNVRVEALRTPSRASTDESIDLRVTTRAAVDTEVDVRVLRDGEVVRSGRRRLAAGEDVFYLTERATTPGLHRYEVQISPVDPSTDVFTEDDAAAAFVRVVGAPRALILEGDPGRAEALERSLTAAAFDVEVASATQAPAVLTELAARDLVVLSDVPAEDLSPEQLEDVAQYVERVGGGLLLLGGDRSMGPGGYAKTPVEEVSPVSFDLKNEKRRARLAEVILIDYSGSMGASASGHTKLELANEAAVRSESLLGPIDRVGVAHVDTTVSWTVPLAPLSDPTTVERRIRAVTTGGGGIYVDVALEAAYAALAREPVERKHVLLFADGDDAEERARAPELARAALLRGITTSVVSLGQGRDAAALEALSREGKGRFYLIQDATRLPAVFAEETTIAAGSALHEEPFRAAVGAPSPATRGVDFAEAPALGGYVVTRAKGRAEVALLATEGDPLLATWPIGSGRAGAFTSDYKDRWGEAWTGWPGAARLFAQLGRDLARRGEDPRVTLEAEASLGTLRVRASARAEDGGSDAFRHLTATVAGPGGFSTALALVPAGPGEYAAAAPVLRPGPYVVSVTDDGAHDVVATTGAVLSAADELEPTGTDHATLSRIAEISSGRVRATLGDVFRDRRAPKRVFRPISPILLAVAAFAMLASVATRRLAPPAGERTTVRRASRADTLDTRPLERSTPPVAPAETTEPGTTAEVLLGRKRRRK
jgi:uncharacterized membrane protein